MMQRDKETEERIESNVIKYDASSTQANHQEDPDSNSTKDAKGCIWSMIASKRAGGEMSEHVA